VHEDLEAFRQIATKEEYARLVFLRDQVDFHLHRPVVGRMLSALFSLMVVTTLMVVPTVCLYLFFDRRLSMVQTLAGAGFATACQIMLLWAEWRINFSYKKNLLNAAECYRAYGLKLLAKYCGPGAARNFEVSPRVSRRCRNCTE
jgi:hypothetical protein